MNEEPKETVEGHLGKKPEVELVPWNRKAKRAQWKRAKYPWSKQVDLFLNGMNLLKVNGKEKENEND